MNCMKKMSTMLGLVLFFPLFANADVVDFTLNGKSVSLEVSTCDDSASLSEGNYCADESGKLSIVTKIKTSENFLGTGGKTVVKHRHLTKSELRAFAKGYLSAQLTANVNGNGGSNGNGNVNVCTDGSGCTDVNVSGGGNGNNGGNANNSGGNNNGGNNGGSNSSGGNANGGGKVTVYVDGSGDGGGRGRRGRWGRWGRGGNANGGGYGDDPRIQAQLDFNALKDFCSGLTDKIIDRDAEVDDLNTQIADLNLDGLLKAKIRLTTRCWSAVEKIASSWQ